MAYIWHKSNYRLMKGRWGIFILLEAGYQISSAFENPEQYEKTGENIYFRSMLLPYPQSQSLTPEEISLFCKGLKMIEKYILPKKRNTDFLTIVLRQIEFSDCYLQKEAFVAAAIQWASEVFNFPMPDIEVCFDGRRTEDGMNGRYLFDFSSVE